MVNQMGPFRVGISLGGHVPISHLSPSVKGKKGIARSRAISTHTKSEAINTPNWSWRITDGSKGRIEENFKFTASVQTEEGHKVQGKSRGGFDGASDRRVDIGGGEVSIDCSD